MLTGGMALPPPTLLSIIEGGLGRYRPSPWVVVDGVTPVQPGGVPRRPD